MPPELPILPARLRRALLALSALVVSAIGWGPMLVAWKNTQHGDGPYFHRLLEAARVSVADFHELPLWNPYECGGAPLWDNPQSLQASPLTWIALLIGTTWTMKLWYVLHSAAGFICMWLFVRKELSLTRTTSFITAVAWTFCGFFMHHLSGGHAAFVPFLYFPGALYLWRAAEKDVKAAVWLGLMVAVMIFDGGALPLSYLAALLGLESITRLWPARRVLHMVRAGAITGVVALSVGAVRFFPVFDQMRSHKRPLGIDHDMMPWEWFPIALLDRAWGHSQRFSTNTYVWGEYASYVGPILLAFAIAGVVLGTRKTAWMVALLVVFVFLTRGWSGEYSLWAILHKHIYPFKEMRVPSRFILLVTMFVVILAGVGVDGVVQHLRQWKRLPEGVAQAAVMLVPILAAVGAGDVVGRGLELVTLQAATDPPPAKVTPGRLFLGGHGMAGYIDHPAQHRGRLECYEPWSFYEGAPLWTGDVPQVRAAPGSKAVVTNVRRTQNTFTFDVDAPEPTRLQVNSAYDQNWRTTVGTTAEENRELVVDVPAGQHHVRMRYRPKTFIAGAVVTLLGIAAVIAFFVRARRKEAERETANPTVAG